MREPLSYAIAHGAAEAALDRARAEGLSVCVAVVNSSGAAKVLLQDDGIAPMGLEMARRKAYTAAAMHMSTDAFAKFTAGGSVAPHLLDAQFLPIPGGQPIVVAGGEVIGGIGVAGADSATDDRLAAQALASVAALLA